MLSSSAYSAVPQNAVTAGPLPSSALLEDDDIGLDDSTELLNTLNPAVEYIHYILGSAVLLPWNVLITASPYFASRFVGSAFRNTFSSYLSCSFTAVNFFALAYATLTAKEASPRRRINLSILVLSFLVLLLTLSTFVHTSPTVFFAFLILSAVCQATSGSFLQASTVAVASMFGPPALQALFTGQAIVAVVISAVQVASSAISIWRNKDGQSLQEDQGKAAASSAFIFFGLSTIFLLASAAAHAYLIRLPAYQMMVGHRLKDAADRREELDSRQQIDSETSAQRLWRVAKSNVLWEMTVAICFVVTLAVFPPITISIQSTNPATHPLLFSAGHFLIFNAGDFLGRYLCKFQRLQIWKIRPLLIISVCRALFIPLFLACNIQRGVFNTTPSLIQSDMLFFIILLAFGSSNGYVSTMGMMSVSSLEHNPNLQGQRNDVDVAATLASFCIVIGLAVGSMASFAVRSMVCKCNPFLG